MSKLLQAVVDLGHEAFGAASCSVALLDDDAHELVFAAVSGEGGSDLVGARFRVSEGVAGRAVRTREVQVSEDLTRDALHAEEIAVATGYTPDRMLVAPLRLGNGPVFGTLSVLDRDTGRHDGQRALELLAELAQVAVVAAGVTR